MIHNPNALIVPGLPSVLHGGDEVTRIVRAMEAGGIQPLTLNPQLQPGRGIPTTLEYYGDMEPSTRRHMAEYAEAQRGLIAEASVVVVANALDELIGKPSSEPFCRVPFAVGRIASNIISIANEVYGSNSGRVFLSRRCPDLTELSSLDSRHDVIDRASLRLLGVYPMRPVALQGDYERMIKMAKTPRTP